VGRAGDRLKGTSFAGAVIHSVQFPGQVSLEGTDFSGAHIESVGFANSKLRGATFVDAELQLVRFEGADLTDANLAGMTTDNQTYFTGVIWKNTTCPDGTNSDNNGGTCLGHLSP
jgi:uncharacterized protein YjbI with pentapeptide repeats